MANVQDPILLKVVGEICNMLANVILLAPMTSASRSRITSVKGVLTCMVW
jgi:hypothetical protein